MIDPRNDSKLNHQSEIFNYVSSDRKRIQQNFGTTYHDEFIVKNLLEISDWL